MINIAKSVLALANMTEDLKALVDMAEKVNSLEQCEAEHNHRIKLLQGEAEKWNNKVCKAKVEAEQIEQQAASVLAAAKDESEALLAQANVDAQNLRDAVMDDLHAAEAHALTLVTEAKEKAAKIEEEALAAAAARDAAADKLGQIQDAIKKITG